jgi:hypothetical protein
MPFFVGFIYWIMWMATVTQILFAPSLGDDPFSSVSPPRGRKLPISPLLLAVTGLALAMVGISLALLAATRQQVAPGIDPIDVIAAPSSVVDALPNVLLIGDSISIDYTEPVRDFLRGKANVYRIPANGGSTRAGLQHIERWLGDRKWDVIHFNFGLHDLGRRTFMRIKGPRVVSLDDYARNIEAITLRLKRSATALIFAATTPVPIGVPRSDAGAECEYNEVAFPIMVREGVQINDLHSFALMHPSLQKAADVHFTTLGSQSLAKQVAASVVEALHTTGTEKEMLRKLPPPPAELWTRSEAEVVAWLEKVGKVGGSAAIRFAFSAHHWPGAPAQRSALWSKVDNMEREAEDRERTEEDKRQEQLRAKALANQKRELKKSGWQRYADIEGDASQAN